MEVQIILPRMTERRYSITTRRWTSATSSWGRGTAGNRGGQKGTEGGMKCLLLSGYCGTTWSVSWFRVPGTEDCPSCGISWSLLWWWLQSARTAPRCWATSSSPGARRTTATHTHYLSDDRCSCWNILRGHDSRSIIISDSFTSCCSCLDVFAQGFASQATYCRACPTALWFSDIEIYKQPRFYSQLRVSYKHQSKAER